MMTFQEIFMDYIRHAVAHPEQRDGQVLFNYLYANEQTREYAESIRGTELDPFYNDEIVPKVLANLGTKMLS